MSSFKNSGMLLSEWIKLNRELQQQDKKTLEQLKNSDEISHSTSALCEDGSKRNASQTNKPKGYNRDNISLLLPQSLSSDHVKKMRLGENEFNPSTKSTVSRNNLESSLAFINSQNRSNPNENHWYTVVRKYNNTKNLSSTDTLYTNKGDKSNSDSSNNLDQIDNKENFQKTQRENNKASKDSKTTRTVDDDKIMVENDHITHIDSNNKQLIHGEKASIIKESNSINEKDKKNNNGSDILNETNSNQEHTNRRKSYDKSDNLTTLKDTKKVDLSSKSKYDDFKKIDKENIDSRNDNNGGKGSKEKEIKMDQDLQNQKGQRKSRNKIKSLKSKTETLSNDNDALKNVRNSEQCSIDKIINDLDKIVETNLNTIKSNSVDFPKENEDLLKNIFTADFQENVDKFLHSNDYQNSFLNKCKNLMQ